MPQYQQGGNKEKDMKNIIVGHEHILDEHCVCPKFIGSKFIQRLVNKHTLPFVLLLDNLIPWTDSDSLSRYADFIRNENKTQSENFKELKSTYPEGSEYVILTVDMRGMGAGAPAKSFESQLLEVIALKNAGEKIKLFYHLDPTVKGSIELMLEYAPYIDGLKVYTLMGHYPTHSRLMEAYRWCENKGIPVVFHTSPGSPVHFKGSRKELNRRLELGRRFPLLKQSKRRPSKSDLCANFTNPLYYEYLLKEFPGVNFDFAHLAGEAELRKHMKGETSMTSLLLALMREYPNAYGDISYTFYDRDLQLQLLELLDDEKLRPKLLYGTDFYMNKTVCTTQQAFYGKLISIIGPQAFQEIAITNPAKFHKHV